MKTFGDRTIPETPLISLGKAAEKPGKGMDGEIFIASDTGAIEIFDEEQDAWIVLFPGSATSNSITVKNSNIEGVLNVNETTESRLVLPVGVNKYATK